MNSNIEQKLVSLGAETLAKALMTLSTHSDAASNIIERLTASDEEKIKKIKSGISGLKRSRKYVMWRDSNEVRFKLLSLIEDIENLTIGNKKQLELALSLMDTDNATLQRCDDSSGIIGDVYRYEMHELIVKLAIGCDDKKWLQKRLLKLLADDEFSIKQALFDQASLFLDESTMRSLLTHFTELAQLNNDKWASASNYQIAISLAAQLKEAQLHEALQKQAHPQNLQRTLTSCAQVYYNTGDSQKALIFLEKLLPTYMKGEAESLLLKIYQELGKEAELTALLTRRFKRSLSVKDLDTLIAHVGAEKKQDLIKNELAAINSSNHFAEHEVTFLIDCEAFDKADEYLLRHSANIDGIFYTPLLRLIKMFAINKRAFAQSLLYRALLDSILKRAISKHYPHGVRYLKALNQLALEVENWHSVRNHQDYYSDLYEKHKKKYSFWSNFQ